MSVNSEETWRPIVGFLGYDISDHGAVRHWSAGADCPRPVKAFANEYGHMRVNLYFAGKMSQKTVSRLVLEAFVGRCPENHEVRHHPDNSHANCRLENLSWVSKKEARTRHAQPRWRRPRLKRFPPDNAHVKAEKLARFAADISLDSEQWKTVVGYPLYMVSSEGRVATNRRCRTPRILTPSIVKGYPVVSLSNDQGRAQKKVHVLVLAAFVGPRHPNMEGCHKNGKRGDPRLENLRYGTSKSNSDDMIEHGTRLARARHPKAKLSDWDVAQIRAQRGFLSTTHLGTMFGIGSGHVSAIQLGKVWRGTSP